MQCSGVQWNGIDGMEWSGVDFGFCPRDMLRTQHVHEQIENKQLYFSTISVFLKLAHFVSFCGGRFLDLLKSSVPKQLAYVRFHCVV